MNVDLKFKPIQEVKIHDHTCLVFSSQREFFHCAIPFIREGLKNNEKCLIIIDEITKEDVLRNFNFVFREGPIPSDDFGTNGRISIEYFKNIYLQDGTFDMEKTANS